VFDHYQRSEAQRQYFEEDIQIEAQKRTKPANKDKVIATRKPVMFREQSA